MISTSIIFDFISLVAIVWTIIQHFQLRHKISSKNVLNAEDLDALQLVMNKFDADLIQLRAETTTSHVELWDFIDNALKPIKQRLSTRESRANQLQDQTKKGGMIPYPVQYGTNKQS